MSGHPQNPECTREIARINDDLDTAFDQIRCLSDKLNVMRGQWMAVVGIIVLGSGLVIYYAESVKNSIDRIADVTIQNAKSVSELKKDSEYTKNRLNRLENGH